MTFANQNLTLPKNFIYISNVIFHLFGNIVEKRTNRQTLGHIEPNQFSPNPDALRITLILLLSPGYLLVSQMISFFQDFRDFRVPEFERRVRTLVQNSLSPTFLLLYLC